MESTVDSTITTKSEAIGGATAEATGVDAGKVVAEGAAFDGDGSATSDAAVGAGARNANARGKSVTHAKLLILTVVLGSRGGWFPPWRSGSTASNFSAGQTSEVSHPPHSDAVHTSRSRTHCVSLPRTGE